MDSNLYYWLRCGLSYIAEYIGAALENSFSKIMKVNYNRIKYAWFFPL